MLALAIDFPSQLPNVFHIFIAQTAMSHHFPKFKKIPWRPLGAYCACTENRLEQRLHVTNTCARSSGRFYPQLTVFNPALRYVQSS